MKTLLGMALFFVCNYAFSTEENTLLLKTPVQIISQINTGRLVSPVAPMCISNLLYQTEGSKKGFSELFNKCAVDLCGPVDKNKTAWITNDNFAQSFPASIMQKVEAQDSIFKKIFDLNLEKKLKELKIIKNSLSGITETLENMPFGAKESLDRLLFEPYIEKVINPSEGPHKKIVIKIVPPKNATSDMLIALKDYAWGLEESIRSNPFMHNDLANFSDEDIAVLTADAFAKMKAGAPEKYQKTITEDENPLKKEKVLRRDYEMALRSLYLLNYKILNETKKSPLRTASCENPSCKKIYQEFFKNPTLEKNITQYETLLNDPRTKTNAINRCKATVATHENKAINIKKASEIFEKSKADIIKNLLPNFSEHSRNLMINFLNKDLAIASSKVSGNTEQLTIKKFMASANEYINYNALTSGNLEGDSLWKKISVLQKSFSDIDPLDDISPCGSKENLTFNSWDLFVPKEARKTKDLQLKSQLLNQENKNLVVVSDFSCQKEDHGKHNTSHEISHALNYLFATTKLSDKSAAYYNDLRKCVNSNYPESMRVETSFFPEEILYTTEDIADLLAIMSNPNDSHLYSCAFLKPSLTTDSYADLHFLKEGSGDNHSTGFSRILIEATNKKIPLPESCQQLIAEEKPSIKFNACL